MDAHSTCWTMIRAAAAGAAEPRADFARRYEPVLRAYLGARWRDGGRTADLDDALQEIFVECYRDDGVLARAAENRAGGFRAFLYGVARNVARRIEERAARRSVRTREPAELNDLPADEPALSRVFDRAWARTLLRAAAAHMAEQAAARDAAAQRRVELLRMRFYEDLPIREIARKWETDPAQLHRDYARAREEFRAALLSVLTFHQPQSETAAQQECERLLGLLSE